jgi:Myosin N-terminal SH3-like domain
MPNLSHLQDIESSRAAALQAEFIEKKWVWVPDAREGYLAGWVNEEEEDAAQVIMAAGGEVTLFEPLKICPTNNCNSFVGYLLKHYSR